MSLLALILKAFRHCATLISLTLFIVGNQLFARTMDGVFFNVDQPEQSLMMVGEELPLRPLSRIA